MTWPDKIVNIVGTRGVPAMHGGFETFAEHMALFLAARGWKVNVYCQDDVGAHPDGHRDAWNGVGRTHFRSGRSGPMGTILFDLKCTRHVLREPGIDLVLGYNTAIFVLLQKLRRRRVLMNMDGIEWKRSKWGLAAKSWFWFNEIVGANISNVPIADHPEIARHISARSLRTPVMIPYGSDRIDAADAAIIEPFGVEPDQYFVSIARIEPENSILELVRAAAGLPSGMKALILGKFEPENPYHQKVKAAAGEKVLFPGAIYDAAIVKALRFHAFVYLHGHQVGGTNPSLVEALGAGNAVLAHDNPFNRWTAGEAQFFFNGEQGAAARMIELCEAPDAVARARVAASARHASEFTWQKILESYEEVLLTRC